MPKPRGNTGNLAGRIESYFRTRFWLTDRFAEYIHPERGLIDHHGLTDVDWSAIALAWPAKNKYSASGPN